MSEDIENTSIEEESLNISTEIPEENIEKADINHERVPSFNKFFSNIKNFTQNVPKYILPQIPAGKGKQPIFFFPQLPKNASGSEFSAYQCGIGYGSYNSWFFILLQLIIIMFLIKWLYCTCGRDC